MAIEDAMVYVLGEIPVLVLSKVLRRNFPLTPKRAETTATFIFFALVLGLCFLAWFFYQRP